MIKYSSASTGLSALVENIKTKEKFSVSTVRNSYGVYETIVVRAPNQLTTILNSFTGKAVFIVNSSTQQEAEQSHIRTAELFEQLDPKDMIRKYEVEGRVGAQLFMSRKDEQNNFLQDKTVELQGKIINNSAEAANAIRDLTKEEKKEDGYPKFDDEEWMAVCFEFIYFYLHLTDRFAFGNIDENKRNKIMPEFEKNTIALAVDSICKGWPDDLIKRIKDECMHNLFVSIEEYSKYKKWFAEKDKGTKDTLFWEFGKVIAKLAKREKNIIYIYAAIELVTKSLKNLDIKKVIDRIR